MVIRIGDSFPEEEPPPEDAPPGEQALFFAFLETFPGFCLSTRFNFVLLSCPFPLPETCSSSSTSSSTPTSASTPLPFARPPPPPSAKDAASSALISAAAAAASKGWWPPLPPLVTVPSGWSELKPASLSELSAVSSPEILNLYPPLISAG